jgi:hypothetical protein
VACGGSGCQACSAAGGSRFRQYARTDRSRGSRRRAPETSGPSRWARLLHSLEAIYRTDRPPGPGAAWMIQRLCDQADDVKFRRPPSPPRERRPLVVRGRDSHPGGRAQRQKLANKPVSGPGARATTVMASEMTASSEASCSPCLPCPCRVRLFGGQDALTGRQRNG